MEDTTWTSVQIIITETKTFWGTVCYHFYCSDATLMEPESKMNFSSDADNDDEIIWMIV